jgi:predicted AlkP superfamily phosphohydrolase/phosphomutase
MLFRKKQRVLVIGIDGTPFTFLKKHIEAGDFPTLKSLSEQGAFTQMDSVQPCISSVAWSTYMTGKNPGKHGIFGFIDRTPNPFKIYIPNSRNMTSDTLWEILSRNGKTVVVINVPVTYPPRQVNGVLIGCFLSADIDKAVYPPGLVPKLKQMGYRIDVDAWQGHNKDKEAFLQDVDYTLNKRWETARYFMKEVDWDFFQLHIMETDRINHFLWEYYENNDVRYAKRFLDFYKLVDAIIGDLVNSVRDSDLAIVLSDHGFCSVKKEVYLNYALEENGFLTLTPEAKSVADMTPETKAYSLIPGRIFLNLKGREERGTIEPGREAETILSELEEWFLTLKDNDTGEPIIKETIRSGDLYHGEQMPQAPDLLAIPYDGFDMKGNVKPGKLTHKGELVGTHTFHDAALFVRSHKLSTGRPQLQDMMPSILEKLQTDIPANIDGRPVFN